MKKLLAIDFIKDFSGVMDSYELEQALNQEPDEIDFGGVFLMFVSAFQILAQYSYNHPNMMIVGVGESLLQDFKEMREDYRIDFDLS